MRSGRFCSLVSRSPTRRDKLDGRSGGSWIWAFAAAAALLLAIYVGHIAGTRSRPAHSPAVRTHQVRPNEMVLYEASTDASALSSDDFIAVPYAPPLAQGEIVRVVHTDLYPQALASLGIGVDPLSAGDTPADVVVGEDGTPPRGADHRSCAAVNF